jgi:hypothetical protein
MGTKQGFLLAFLAGVWPLSHSPTLAFPSASQSPESGILAPLFNCINSRLAATASFLSLDGKIVVTKAILSVLPNFYLYTQNSGRSYCYHRQVTSHLPPLQI